MSEIGSLTPPEKKSNIQNAIETCELMLEESIADARAIYNGKPVAHPHHMGVDYDQGYAQGRKDACRVVLLSFNIVPKNTPEDNSDG